MGSVSKPRLLDLYCCEGGAAAGYSRSGFEVEGVDLAAKYAKRYPFKMHVADAIEFVKNHGHEYDAIHASPPCQRYSITNASRKADYPDLIGPTREALVASGKPYVIENVVGAPLEGATPLCWTMFREPGSVLDDDGEPLQMFRHRLFETSFTVEAPECAHDADIQVAGSYGGARRDKWEAKHIRHGGYVPSKPAQQRLLGIDWMTQYGMYQSIPPIYAEFIGKWLLAAVSN